VSIKTADCKTAIVEYIRDKYTTKSTGLDVLDIKNWKRLAKRGNTYDGYVRQFTNTKMCIQMMIILLI
jgi:hypothetical protein